MANAKRLQLLISTSRKSTIMKHNKNHDNARNAGPPLIPVRFEFIHPTAVAVSVAGSFNHYH